MRGSIQIEFKTTGTTLPTEMNSESGPFRKAWAKLVSGEITLPAFVQEVGAAGINLEQVNLLNAGQTIALPAGDLVHATA